MNRIVLGLLLGLAFGVVDVLVMIPMPEKDRSKKVQAMLGAFAERFMIGFLIPNVDLGIGYVLSGLIIGFGLSLGSAIITKAYIPILTIGAVGGLLIGYISTLV